MKHTFLLFLAIITYSLVSCSSDDDSTTSTSLAGTTWVGQEINDGIYSFASDTVFTFVDEGELPVDGTYTFNGTSGILTEETGFTAEFTVSGGIMSVVGTNATRVYIKQE